MNKLKCTCGCTFWHQMRPEEYDEATFQVWGQESLKPITSPVAALKCLQCGKLELAATSLAGKNQLAPETQAYMRLLELMKTINPQPLEYVQSEVIADPYAEQFEALNNSFKIVKAQCDELLKQITCNAPEEATPDVKTGRRGK